MMDLSLDMGVIKSAGPLPTLLQTPVLSLVSKTDTTTTVDWTDPDNLGSYKLYLDGVEVGSSSTEPFTFEGLTPETAYLIGVSAGDGSVWSPIGTLSVTTDEASVDPEPELPEPPVLSVISITPYEITVSATNPSDADEIIYYLGETQVNFGGGLQLEYTFENLNPNQEYELSARAYDASTSTISIPSNVLVVTTESAIEVDPFIAYLDGRGGLVYNIQDKSTLFQDVNGTIPVEQAGDPVRYIKNKVNSGGDLVVADVNRYCTWETNGDVDWLTNNGVGAVRYQNLSLTMQGPHHWAIAARRLDLASTWIPVEGGDGSSSSYGFDVRWSTSSAALAHDRSPGNLQSRTLLDDNGFLSGVVTQGMTKFEVLRQDGSRIDRPPNLQNNTVNGFKLGNARAASDTVSYNIYAFVLVQGEPVNNEDEDLLEIVSDLNRAVMLSEMWIGEVE